MPERNDESSVSKQSLQEAMSMLIRIVGSVAGATGLIFGIGFVLVNLSLLKHGVYEGTLLRERYLAAGISYIILLAGAFIITLAAYSLAEKLTNRKLWCWLLTVVLAAAMNFVLALVVWEFKAPSVYLLIWALATGCLGLLFLYANPSAWVQQVRNSWGKGSPPSSSRSPRPDRSESGSDKSVQPFDEAIVLFWRRAKTATGLTVLGIFFLVLLATHGRYVYNEIPAALGGGLPVVVQFSGNEEDVAILAGMGFPLENTTTTGQVEFIGQTESRYFVFVRQINWETSLKPGQVARVSTRRVAVSFDKELVRGVRYYPSEYHLTNEFAAVKHIQDGDELFTQGFYDGAIGEYREAIRRQPDFHLAYFKLGQAYLIQASDDLDGETTPAKELVENAVNNLTNAQELNPGEARYWYYLAQAQTLEGDQKHQTAVETLQQAVEREPDYRNQALDEPLFEPLKVREDLQFKFEVIVYGSVGEAALAYAAQGQSRHTAAQEMVDEQERREALEEAVRAYTRAISLTLTVDTPLEEANHRVALAAVYQDQDKPDAALSELEQAVEAAPDNEGYHLQLARIYVDRARWDEAKAQYEAMLARNEQNVNAWLGKGEALRQLGAHREAAEAFRLATELVPEEAKAWYGLGVVQLNFAPAEAEEPLRRTVTLDPDFIVNIRQFLDQAELEVAVSERLEAVLQAAEIAVQGDTALEADDLTQAIDAYRTAVETDPKNIIYLVKLGDSYRNKGDTGAVEFYAEAEKTYRSLIEKVPDDPSYHFRLGSVYAAQGKDAEALNSYDDAIRLAPDVAAYYAGRALLLKQLGRPGDAIEDTEQAIRLDPNNHLYYGQLGQLYYDQEKYDQATENLTQAIEMNPQYAPGFYYLGLAHQAAGNTAEAREAFTSCVEVEVVDTIQQRLCENPLIQLTTPTP